jgi:hypothetical protein
VTVTLDGDSSEQSLLPVILRIMGTRDNFPDLRKSYVKQLGYEYLEISNFASVSTILTRYAFKFQRLSTHSERQKYIPSGTGCPVNENFMEQVGVAITLRNCFRKYTVRILSLTTDYPYCGLL